MDELDLSPILQYFSEHPVATTLTVLFLIAVLVFFVGAIVGLHKMTKK